MSSVHRSRSNAGRTFAPLDHLISPFAESHTPPAGVTAIWRLTPSPVSMKNSIDAQPQLCLSFSVVPRSMAEFSSMHSAKTRNAFGARYTLKPVFCALPPFLVRPVSQPTTLNASSSRMSFRSCTVPPARASAASFTQLAKHSASSRTSPRARASPFAALAAASSRARPAFSISGVMSPGAATRAGLLKYVMWVFMASHASAIISWYARISAAPPP